MLRSLPIHGAAAAAIPKFRSPGSVSRKTTDLASNRPGYTGAPTRCGRLDHEVIARFTRDPNGMLSRAAALRSAYASGELQDTPVQADEADEDGTVALEGRLITRVLLSRERNPQLRRAKIAAAKRAGLPIRCVVCTFDFADVYGTLGEGYIEVHHLLPLHVSGPRETALEDLAFLCANCHRTCHRNYAGEFWRTPDTLRARIAQAAPASA